MKSEKTKEVFRNILHKEWFSYLAVFVSYLATAKLGQYLFNNLAISPAVIWAPAGIALAAVFLKGYKMLWPIVVAQLLSSLTNSTNPPILLALVNTFSYTLQAFLGGYALKKFKVDGAFERIKDVIIFLLLSLIMPVLAPTLITTSRYIGGILTEPFFLTWSRLWAGGVLSIMVLTPFIIAWATRPYPSRSRKYKWETTIALVVLILVVYGIFWSPLGQLNSFLAIYAFFGVFFWIGLRLSPRVMTLSIFLATALGMVGVILVPQGVNPLNQRLFGVELFIELVAPIFMILAAVVEERRIALRTMKGYTEDLENALQKLSEDDHSKNEFIATLAHELRNPIAPVMSTLELLKMKGISSDSLILIKKAEYHIKTMRRLLDDLLDVSRVTQKKFQLQKEMSELGAMIDRCVDNVEGLIKSREHTLSISIPREKIILNVDPVRFEQIITNLLSNAAKYTDPGGTIELLCVLGKNELVLKVKDNGIGINPAAIKEIFSAFHQLHPVSTRGSGLGIGLAITKRLVEMHSGTIEAESLGVGKGSTFTCKFPIENSERLPASTPSPYDSFVRENNTTKQFKILVVDDNEAAAEGLSKLLEYKGHNVDLVYLGKEVLSKANQFQPEVILLDIGLPDMSGYEVAKSLRENKFKSKIIAVSGYGQDEDIRKALESGFDHHLTKPVSIRDIDSLLQKI